MKKEELSSKFEDNNKQNYSDVHILKQHNSFLIPRKKSLPSPLKAIVNENSLYDTTPTISKIIFRERMQNKELVNAPFCTGNLISFNKFSVK